MSWTKIAFVSHAFKQDFKLLSFPWRKKGKETCTYFLLLTFYQISFLPKILGLENLSSNNNTQIAQSQGDYDLYFNVAEIIWKYSLETLN